MAASPWYSATRDAAAVPPAVAQRALQWLVQLQDEGVPPETVHEWSRWRASHPDHERAWLRIESVRGAWQPLASPVRAAIAQAAMVPPASPKRRRVLKTMGLAVLTGGAAWSAEQYAPWREWTSDYRTGVGERQALTLPDGTRLVLNTGSAIDIRFNEAERRVALIAGEILINTAHETRPANRPFLVETAHGTARALGTEYAVRLLDKATEVSVYQGAVQIRLRRVAAPALTLQAGSRTHYSEDGVAAADAALESSVAWKDGFIVARGMRLDDFIAELGRYCRDALSCDPAVAGLRLSGSFPVDDIDRVLDALRATLDVQVQSQARLWGGRRLRLVPGAAGAST